MNILIVEDDPVLSLLMQKMVLRMGNKVIEIVKTGERAVKLVQHHPIDLILMDIMLDGKIDGIDAMNIIRENSTVPVIYVTGNSDPITIKRAKKTKFRDYLVKPVNFSDLKASIRRVEMEM